MKIVYFTTIISSAATFGPHPIIGTSRQGLATQAFLQDYLDQIFQSDKQASAIVPEEEVTHVVAAESKRTSNNLKKADKWISEFFEDFELQYLPHCVRGTRA